jgi:hypothetical protein
MLYLTNLRRNSESETLSPRVYKILGDDTALPAIPSEDRFWIIDGRFPQAVDCGFRFAASKSTLRFELERDIILTETATGIPRLERE